MQYLTKQAMATFLEQSEPTLFGKPLSAETKKHILNGTMPVCLEDGRSFQVAPGAPIKTATLHSVSTAPMQSQLAPPAPAPVKRGLLVAAAEKAARVAGTSDDRAVAEGVRAAVRALTPRKPTEIRMAQRSTGRASTGRAPTLCRAALEAAARATDDDDGPCAA